MVQALLVSASTIDDHGQDWVITPGPLTAPADIDCGLAGNACGLCRLSGLANALFRSTATLGAGERPLAPLVSS